MKWIHCFSLASILKCDLKPKESKIRVHHRVRWAWIGWIRSSTKNYTCSTREGNLPKVANPSGSEDSSLKIPHWRFVTFSRDQKFTRDQSVSRMLLIWEVLEKLFFTLLVNSACWSCNLISFISKLNLRSAVAYRVERSPLRKQVSSGAHIFTAVAASFSFQKNS